MKSIETKQLVEFLKAQNPNAKFLDKLKIVYRPYICPFNELLDEFNPEQSIFDIGCGSGQFALLLAEYCNPKKIKGIEISNELIQNAKSLLKPYENKINISFESYNGTEIPNDISEYDYVTLIDVGHHIPKEIQKTFFHQLFRKMKQGSTLIYKDINASSPLVIANKFHDLILAKEIGNELSAKKTEELFKSIGFEIVKTSKKTMLWYPHFTIIAKK